MKTTEENVKEEPGIYIIVNMYNLTAYVGSTKNIKKRLSEHKRLLESNKHTNKKLQESYKEGNTYFLVIFYLDKDTPNRILLLKEKMYIYKLMTNGYKFIVCNCEDIKKLKYYIFYECFSLFRCEENINRIIKNKFNNNLWNIAKTKKERRINY